MKKRTARIIIFLVNGIFFLWLAFVIFSLYRKFTGERLLGFPKVLAMVSLSLFGMLALVFLVWVLAREPVRRILSHPTFPFFVFVITLAARLFWVYLFRNVDLENGDFDLYMKLASSLAATGRMPEEWLQYIAYAPNVFGYPGFLAVLFKIFGAKLLVAQLANAVLSALTGVLLFLVARKMALPIRNGEDTGLIAGGVSAIIWLVLPATSAMTTIPATEPLFIFLFLLVIYLCFSVVNHLPRKTEFLFLALILFFILISNEVRAFGILLIISLALLYLLVKRFSLPAGFFRLSAIALCVVLFFAAGTGIKTWKDGFIGREVATNGYGFGLYLGMNDDTNGTWSLDDASQLSLMHEKGYTAQQFHQEMIRLAGERFRQLNKEHRFWQFMIRKASIFWTFPNIFIDFTQYYLGGDPNRRWLRLMLNPMDAAYGTILLLCLAEVLLAARRKDYAYQARLLYLKFMLVILLIFHSIFDANSRYIIPAIPLFSLIATNGVIGIASYLFHPLRNIVRNPVVL